MKSLLPVVLLAVFLALAGCRGEPPRLPVEPAPLSSTMPPNEQQIDALLAMMTLAEKIGQMTQVEVKSLQPGDVTTYFIGKVLSGGDGQGEGT